MRAYCELFVISLAVYFATTNTHSKTWSAFTTRVNSRNCDLTRKKVKGEGKEREGKDKV